MYREALEIAHLPQKTNAYPSDVQYLQNCSHFSAVMLIGPDGSNLQQRPSFFAGDPDISRHVGACFQVASSVHRVHHDSLV